LVAVTLTKLLEERTGSMVLVPMMMVMLSSTMSLELFEHARKGAATAKVSGVVVMRVLEKGRTSFPGIICFAQKPLNFLACDLTSVLYSTLFGALSFEFNMFLMVLAMFAMLLLLVFLLLPFFNAQALSYVSNFFVYSGRRSSRSLDGRQ